MSRRSIAALGALAVSVPSLGAATTAVAFAPTVAAKIVSYAPNHAGGGTLKVTVKHKPLKLVVTKTTVCGYTTGQSGGPMPCKSLAKYKHHTVNLRYAKQGHQYVASFAVVVK